MIRDSGELGGEDLTGKNWMSKGWNPCVLSPEPAAVITASFHEPDNKTNYYGLKIIVSSPHSLSAQ